MVLTSQNACDILGLSGGVDRNSIIRRYKELAIKWHPENEKHKHSAESLKKFKQVTLAFKRLTSDDFKQDMNVTECLSVFQQVVLNRAVSNGSRYNNQSESSDENSDDESSEDSEDDGPEYRRNNTGFSNSHISRTENNSSNGVLGEDDRDRRKAEKRRAKKKRQRERKRLEREQKTVNTNKKDSKGVGDSKDNSHERLSGEDTPFDPSHAFFTKVVNKRKKNALNQEQSSSDRRDRRSDEEAEEIVDPKVLRSRQLAIRGNEMAQVEEYTAAIELFTEAISLDPTDFRFFGNRSYCFDRTDQFEKALKDAEKAIKLDKDWPKGYFRKGRALAGLKKFIEAEKSFIQVLKLDKNCDDAVTELLRVRTHQLMDMGFSRQQSEEAIQKHNSVSVALDSLLTGGDIVNDLYISDDEDEGFSVHRTAPIPPPTSHPTDVKMDPTNPEGLTALWVGNVLPSVTEKRLNSLFSKFGQVTSVRPLPDKYCAFINFKTKESAGRAMHQLQGTEVDGQKLLIKFPDNPLTNSSGNLTIRKPAATNGNATVKNCSNVRNTPKQTGPVNGVECYFWRTTGCTFGSDCKWQHLPRSKGIDRKPWQK